ncbi:hypothetical protein RM697_06470 [Ichthyenterobacterium sp. W332]|uniref:Uncharacterized protein n=1 Tax=Microcosmobacter mediterraneus TaxID=3075607 RepID=A0ABU2YLY6_9FLAO|nr:hypothetical protein [Ichthyenterobacterium sp. W332]MDT0558280.1 hypothetical protein [Ichthyenterobacterium sp. W332]
MKLHNKIILLAVFGVFTQPILAQTSYAKIEKNFNIRADGLYHDLNTTKDTLILKSDKKINYVYSINRAVKRELSYTVNATDFKVPLRELSVGKHVFVVVQSPVRIVFVVKVFGRESIDISTAEVTLAETSSN